MRFLITKIGAAVVFLATSSLALAERGPIRAPTAQSLETSGKSAARPDSMTWQRFPKRLPPGARVVRERKFGEVGHGALLDTVVARLRTNGFFEVTSAQIAEACGNPGDSVARFAIRVHDGGAWREVVIPDGCTPSSTRLAVQIDGMVKTVLAARGGWLGPRQPSHGG